MSVISIREDGNMCVGGSLGCRSEDLRASIPAQPLSTCIPMGNPEFSLWSSVFLLLVHFVFYFKLQNECWII